MDRFEPIFEALNSTGVRYVVVVGAAVLEDIRELLAEDARGDGGKRRMRDGNTPSPPAIGSFAEAARFRLRVALTLSYAERLRDLEACGISTTWSKHKTRACATSRAASLRRVD